MSSDTVRPLVLVVEDDPDTRDMYALFLDFSGVSVITASDADAAFELTVQRRPRMIVTDLFLSGSATGADLCRRIHDDPRTAHIPALLLTGSTRHLDGLADCAEIRIKPYLPDALVEDIHQILGLPRNQPVVG